MVVVDGVDRLRDGIRVRVAATMETPPAESPDGPRDVPAADPPDPPRAPEGAAASAGADAP